MYVRHTGQSLNLGAHSWHVTKCPHGRNTVLTSLSMQTLQVLASTSWRFSHSRRRSSSASTGRCRQTGMRTSVHPILASDPTVRSSQFQLPMVANYATVSVLCCPLTCKFISFREFIPRIAARCFGEEQFVEQRRLAFSFVRSARLFLFKSLSLSLLATGNASEIPSKQRLNLTAKNTDISRHLDSIVTSKTSSQQATKDQVARQKELVSNCMTRCFPSYIKHIQLKQSSCRDVQVQVQ